MKSKKQKPGRKTVMTKSVLGKLEEAFSWDCNDREAALYAGINPDTLYEYQKKNPEFSERKALLKNKHILAARSTIVKSLKTDVKIAMWYLERKRRDEFSPKYIQSAKEYPSAMSPEHKQRVIEILGKMGEID